jgi:hypothetical protein
VIKDGENGPLLEIIDKCCFSDYVSKLIPSPVLIKIISFLNKKLASLFDNNY